MLYPTLNQPLVLLMVVGAGLFCGLLFDVARILSLLSGNDKASVHIFDFLATVLSFCILFFVNLKFNYGQFRAYVLFVFVLGFAFQRFLSQKLWTKLLAKWYSSIVGNKHDRKTKRKKMG